MVLTALLTMALTVVLLAAVACRQPPAQDAELETVDVQPGIEIDTSEDPRAAEKSAQLVGVLPGDFPRDLPLYLPASLVDFGEVSAGRFSVTLLTPDGVAQVRRTLLERLRAAGWTVSAGAGDAVVLVQGGRRAWLYLEESTSATRYRYEYRH